MLEEIIRSNSELSKFPRLVSILNKVESIIPGDSRERFYNNLKTLHISFSSLHDESYYDYRNNAIIINPGYHKYVDVDVSQEEKKQLLLLIYDSNLCHELIHMASTKYDTENNEINSGFLTIRDNKPFNYYLNEGFTELLTLQVYPKMYNFSGYKDTVYITALINNLIGNIDAIKKMYFSDGTVEDLKKSFIDSQDYGEIFERIEEIPYIKAANDIKFYNFNIMMILRLGLTPLLNQTIRNWIASGIITSKEELEEYYSKYLYPNIISLINILKSNNFKDMKAVTELDFDNFLEQYNNLFKSSVKK